MENKLLVAGVILSLLFGTFAFGFALHTGNQVVVDQLSPSGKNLGAVIGYQSAGNQQLTFNALNSLLQDITAVRLPLSGVLSSSTVWSPGIVATSTSATTTVTGVTGALLGDFVIVSATSTGLLGTVGGAQLSGYVSSSSIVTITLSNVSVTSSLPAINNGTFNVRVIPAATFAAPATLLSSTSTTTN